MKVEKKGNTLFLFLTHWPANVWLQKGRGGQGSRKFLRRGGVSIIYLFLPDRFYDSDMFNFRLFAFCSQDADAKINLVNSTK